MSGVELIVGEILSVQDKYVISAVHAHTANGARYPTIGKSFGPVRIYFEPGRLALGLCQWNAKECCKNAQRHELCGSQHRRQGVGVLHRIRWASRDGSRHRAPCGLV